jgi:NADH:ubiquinone oxidoreductase subunit 6 (subunit J)
MVKQLNSRNPTKKLKSQIPTEENHSRHHHTGPLAIIIVFIIFLLVLMAVWYYYYNYSRPLARDVPAANENHVTTGTPSSLESNGAGTNTP